jgi:glutamyl-tRNA reductase
MHVFLIGLNHETAPVELREKIAFSQKDLGEALTQILNPESDDLRVINEAVILSTCNRVEIYATATNIHEGTERIANFLAEFHHLDKCILKEHLYQKVGFAAVEHLFSVTSGINSMVVGETQIQGQVKKATETAHSYETSGPILGTLFQNALTTGKRVRSETAISEHSLSVSQAAVAFLKNLYEAQITDKKILVVGTGKMSVIALNALVRAGVKDITIINRSREKAQQVADELNARAFGFEKLRECLLETDIVIASTGAPHVILTCDLLSKILAEAPGKELTIVDIAVPRDVEPEVSEIAKVDLYNIDHLKIQLDSNLARRCQEISNVREIIREEMEKFREWYQALEVKPVITDLRRKSELIRETELKHALRRMESDLSENDRRVLEDLSRRIINKLLHQPFVRLREEAIDGNGHNYTAAVRNLFDLNEAGER